MAASGWHVYLAISLILYLIDHACGLKRQDVYFKNLDLYSYRNFGSLQTIHFEIPEDSYTVSWNLELNKTNKLCEDINIFLLTQYGSFPLDFYDGEYTFPSAYRVNRTGFFKTNMTNYKSLLLDRPVYGQWFLGAVIEQHKNQVVKKLSTLWCDYRLVGNVSYLLEDVEILLPGKKLQLNVTKQSTYYKFFIKENIYKYTLLFENCDKKCNISILTKSGGLPREFVDSLPHHLTCDHSPPCKMGFDVYSPEADKWQYIHLSTKEEDLPLSVEINTSLFECTTGSLINQTDVPLCYMMTQLITSSMPDNVYSSTFSFNYDETDSILIPRPFVSMTTFVVDRFKDVGGTLTIDLDMMPIDVKYFAANQTHEVWVCVQRGFPTISSNNQLSCRDDNSMLKLNFSNPHAILHFPYPEPGIYFIGLQDLSKKRENINNNESGMFDPNLPSASIFVNVKVAACEETKCENGGSCRSAIKGPFVMSFCYCIAGSQGFTCADKSRMASPTLQLFYTLMLCLSNLAFIPAIIISFRRWRYMECIIYCLNMFWSTFYHACDMSYWSVYGLCFTSYKVYQFSDFFLSLLSFWFTLLAMSRIKSGYILPILILGIVITAILLVSTTVGFVTNFLPIASGTLIVVVTWGWRSYKARALYPNKKDYLWIIPGISLAALGLIVFAFVENDSNYPYTHSFWHLCVAFCIPLVLPRNKVIWQMNEITCHEAMNLHESQAALEDEDETVLVCSNSVQLQHYRSMTSLEKSRRSSGVSIDYDQFGYSSLP